MPANQSCSCLHIDAMIVSDQWLCTRDQIKYVYVFIFGEPTRVSRLIHLSLNVNISSFYLAHLWTFSDINIDMIHPKHDLPLFHFNRFHRPKAITIQNNQTLQPNRCFFFVFILSLNNTQSFAFIHQPPTIDRILYCFIFELKIILKFQIIVVAHYYNNKTQLLHGQLIC